jgi:predicted nucleic acid-binding protein
MLHTNIVGHFLKEDPAVVRHVVAASMTSLSVSAITAGELLFGLATRPAAARLHLAVGEFLRRVDVLPWDHAVATRYGTVRAELQNGENPRSPRYADRDPCIARRCRYGDQRWCIPSCGELAYRGLDGLTLQRTCTITLAFPQPQADIPPVFP